MFAKITMSPGAEAGIKHGGEARGWAGTHLKSLTPDFFHRRPDGRTQEGISPFTVRFNGEAVCVEAVGRNGFLRLTEVAPELQKEFIAQYPQGEFSLNMGTMSFGTSDRIISYECRDFVLQGTKRYKNLYQDVRAGRYTAQQITAIAEELFHRKLEERAALVDIELPENAIFAEFEATEVKPSYAGGQPKFAVCLFFRTNVIFNGPWYVGRLANKAGGRITACRFTKARS